MEGKSGNKTETGKICRVKFSTKTHKKRKRFCAKKRLIDSCVNSVNIVDNVESSVDMVVENTVNIVHNTPPQGTNSSASKTVSENKVEPIISATPKSTDPITGYRLINVEILNSVFNAMKCPECDNVTLSLSEKLSKKKGCASYLSVQCSCCSYINEFYTSENRDKTSDVNKRIVYAMRSCRQGYSGIETFTTLMDIPKPMTAKNYDKLVSKFVTATKAVAEETMEDAAEEIRSKVNSDSDTIIDTSVSQDGSWQRRGYSSLNGCVTAIAMDNEKVIDVEPMSRYCRNCSLKEPLRLSDPNRYALWKRAHKCNYNYRGSAGGMETEGAKRIFSRSVEKYKFRYTNLYGDGDSKSHLAVIDTYPGIKVKKLQCVGHVQKRVGSRLSKLKKTEKGLGGKGKLTQATVDRLQNFYGIAIRQNAGKFKAMQDAVRATLFHVASSKEQNYHTAYCPKGNDSWCKFQQDQANNTNTYRPGPGLPLSVIAKVKPIFQDLSSEKLLMECLHGKTQNHNESFNGTIWDRLPKTKFVTLNQLRFGTYDAVANFNIGRKASVLVYEKMGMAPGRFMLKGCDRKNRKRLSFSKYQNQPKTKKRRKVIRGKKKQKDDTDKDKEGTVYKAGAFC